MRLQAGSARQTTVTGVPRLAGGDAVLLQAHHSQRRCPSRRTNRSADRRLRRVREPRAEVTSPPAIGSGVTVPCGGSFRVDARRFVSIRSSKMCRPWHRPLLTSSDRTARHAAFIARASSPIVAWASRRYAGTRRRGRPHPARRVTSHRHPCRPGSGLPGLKSRPSVDAGLQQLTSRGPRDRCANRPVKTIGIRRAAAPADRLHVGPARVPDEHNRGGRHGVRKQAGPAHATDGCRDQPQGR